MNESQFAHGVNVRVRIRHGISAACWDDIGLQPDECEGKRGRATFANAGWHLLFPDGVVRRTLSVHVADRHGGHLGYFPPYALAPMCMFEEVINYEG